MSDASHLNALVERVEAGSGPDRRLDYEVFTATAVKNTANHWDPKSGHEYTSSLDATVALVERVLPEAGWQTGRSRDTGLCAAMITAREPFRGEHPDSVPRALLAATLRALPDHRSEP